MNRYRELKSDELENHFSNFLINSWSYSKVKSFSNNEKEFEMRYIYNESSKLSSSTIAGNAYHVALQQYFIMKNEGITLDIIQLESIAFSFIENISAEKWKLQKTTPTVNDCITTAISNVSQYLNNFLSEIKIYESEIKRIINVEYKIKTWVTVNGVDIPLPCHVVIDLVIETNDDKLVIIDHKSKRSFTGEDEIKFTIGKQAITYVLAYEEETGLKVDEVWYIENKLSKNKDKSPQLVLYKSVMNSDTRKLYEALLYEPLRRMFEAVSNPDYVYMINDYDTLCDKAELYNFWAKTMIAEIEEFDIVDDKKPLIKNRLKKIRDASLATITPNVVKNFRKFAEEFIPYDLTNKNMTNQEKIEHVLRSFGVVTKVQYVFEGYSSSSYLLEVNSGVQISTIQRYRLDIANALNVSNVRINKNLLVYEGKSYVLIESGKKSNDILFFDKSKLKDYKIPVGIDNFGNTVSWDMDNNSTPHLLTCGATGSGKSVFLISTIEYALLAGINDIIIFDPKHEFLNYKKVKGVNVFCEIEEIELQMMILVEEMERRVKTQVNKKTLVIFDEFADAVANSRKGNELKNYSDVIVGNYKNGMPKYKKVVSSVDKALEENLRILLQKGRSSGFRIIASTQRASTKIITGDAKVNFPVQICFRVPKDVDSIVVLDETGAESLNGRGDGLLKSPEYMETVRFQGFYFNQ